MYIARAKDRDDVPNFAKMRDLIIEEFKGMIRKDELRFCEITERCAPRYTIVQDKMPYDWASGQNKIAILDMLDDYVVKFNRGKYDYFSIVREALLYEKAKEEGIEEHFAETYYIGTVDFMAITIQEKVCVDGEENEDILYDFAQKELREEYNEEELDEMYEEHCEELRERGYQHISTFDEYFLDLTSEKVDDWEGADYARLFLGVDLYDFFYRYEINDSHCGNFGFRRDRDFSSMVYIDFSGYYNWETAIPYRFPFEDYEDEEWYDALVKIYSE